jgi:addiction module RelB/DinJ family antitoxin
MNLPTHDPSERDLARLSTFEHNLAMKTEPNPSPGSTLFRARVDAAHLEKARRVLERLGMTPGDAVNVFFAQVALRKDLPFVVTANPQRLQSEAEQAKAWDRALGEY